MLRQFRMPAFVLAGLMVAGAAGLVGCKSDSGGGGGAGAKDAPNKSLYQRLGGHDNIVKVVDSFAARALNDPKVNFPRTNPPHPTQWHPSDAEAATFKKNLVAFIEENTGGPKAYKGKEMAALHKGMEITDDEFNALAADLKATLDEFKVPAKEQQELIAVVASTRSSIVGK